MFSNTPHKNPLSLNRTTTPPMTAPVSFQMNQCSPNYYPPGAVTEVESHFLSFFLARPSRDFLFFFQPWTSPAHPTAPFKKNIPTYPAPLPMLQIFFFFISLFLFAVIVNATTMSHCLLLSSFVLFMQHPIACSHLLLFFLCAPKEDNHKLLLVIVFFCFVSVHLKKTTTSQICVWLVIIFIMCKFHKK